MRGRYLRNGALALASLAPGCSEELGPEALTATRVSGVVREGPRPVAGGWIEFLPTDGTVGNMRSAPIGPDGRFQAVGVAVGANRVGLTGAPLQAPSLRRAFDPLRSTVVRVVPPGPSAEMTIDLYQELARRAAESGR